MLVEVTTTSTLPSTSVFETEGSMWGFTPSDVTRILRFQTPTGVFVPFLPFFLYKVLSRSVACFIPCTVAIVAFFSR